MKLKSLCSPNAMKTRNNQNLNRNGLLFYISWYLFLLFPPFKLVEKSINIFNVTAQSVYCIIKYVVPAIKRRQKSKEKNKTKKAKRQGNEILFIIDSNRSHSPSHFLQENE